MTTREVAKALKLTSQLMELHEANPFKVKSIANAAFRLDKSGVETEGMSLEELEKIDGVGKGIAAKVFELQTEGNLKELQTLIEQTPVGVIDMMGIKGVGPKKIRQLWKELEVESVGELLYACHENRLVDLKGFGAKTQEQVKKQIEFTLANSGKFHYAAVEEFALKLVETIKEQVNPKYISFTGELYRQCEIVEKIEILLSGDTTFDTSSIENLAGIEFIISNCSEEEFHKKLVETSAVPKHLEAIGALENGASEEEVYEKAGLQFIPAPLREGLGEVEKAKAKSLPDLIQVKDLKGILHNHTTYSDGVHSLKEMAEYCKELGYQYLGICDHSKSAFYANGLQPDRVLAQQAEIDQLNESMGDFKIFKGIESDILNDGSLDYEEDILKTFDFVVASVHSNLKMDEEKAMKRLITAIENPYTTILGHPTGRLLLSREGYPIDHKKIIDACAENNVVIELNAHPYRLDIDWRWIPYCIEKGVKVSINPDAHQKQGFHDMYYGVCVAQKGMLTAETCFNAMNVEEVTNHFNAKKINADT